MRPTVTYERGTIARYIRLSPRRQRERANDWATRIEAIARYLERRLMRQRGGFVVTSRRMEMRGADAELRVLMVWDGWTGVRADHRERVSHYDAREMGRVEVNL